MTKGGTAPTPGNIAREPLHIESLNGYKKAESMKKDFCCGELK
jgi:hypothetical protein